jgi:hypothetical protein
MFLRSLGPIAVVLLLPFATALVSESSADALPTEGQLTAARGLFLEAEKDEDALRWQDALDKLTRIAAVKLTSGIRYHIALCEEHLGHLVSALRDYKAAANQAREENAADVLRLVDKRVIDSTERIPQLVLVLVPSLPNATVRLDGETIRPGVPIPVDPGTHNVDAVAPGFAEATRIVTLEERASTSIEVKLDPTAPPAPPPVLVPAPEVTRPPPRTSTSRDRTPAMVAAAGAVGLAGFGVVAYVIAGNQQRDSVQACAQVLSLDPDACDARKNLIRAWDWAAVAGWAGAAGAGAFAVFALTRRHHDAASRRPPEIVIGPTSVGLEGTF